MSAINDFHHKAVDLSAFALMEQMRGNAERSAELFEQALENELAAIEELKEPVEPTYSVLHRSAGWMAFHCRKFRIAEKLAARALSHDPHPEIAEELRDLLEQINFGRHLKLKGVTLAANDIQLSLSGSEVGFGVIRASEFIDRISYSSKLVHRIIERRNNRPFRERGRPSSNIESLYQSYLSIPRAASYAVTLSFSTSSHQPSLPGISDIAEVVDEFMELLELLNSANVSEIQGRIPDPAYLRNFLGLAKKIAPDGDRIRQVGFTVIRGGTEQSVKVVTRRQDMPSSTTKISSSAQSDLVSVNGTLLYADATVDSSNKIRIVDEDQEIHTIEVPVGMMNDIVRPMWDSEVRIEGLRVRRGRSDVTVLRDIWPLDADQADEYRGGRPAQHSRYHSPKLLL